TSTSTSSTATWRASTCTRRASPSTRRRSKLWCVDGALAAVRLRARERLHHVPLEAHEPVELRLENPLLVAVRAEALGAVLFVGGGTHAVALHALAAEKRHVGGRGDHCGQRLRGVMLGDRGLDDGERLVVDPR